MNTSLHVKGTNISCLEPEDEYSFRYNYDYANTITTCIN